MRQHPEHEQRKTQYISLQIEQSIVVEGLRPQRQSIGVQAEATL